MTQTETQVNDLVFHLMNGLSTLTFIFMIVGILLLIALSILPIIIALARRHENTAGIAVVNIALGWTILGYVFALVWALKDSESKNHIVINQIAPQNPPSQIPQNHIASATRSAHALPDWGPEQPVIEILPPPLDKSLKARLEEIKELHECGLLSEEEYQIKRKSLIS